MFRIQSLSVVIQSIILCESNSVTVLVRFLTGTTVQYGRGTLGIHIWEIPASKINSTFNVSFSAHVMSSLTSTAYQRCHHTLLSLPCRRQILATVLLSQALASTMVSHRRLRQHVPRGRLQHRARLPAHLHLYTRYEELRRLHHRGFLP